MRSDGVRKKEVVGHSAGVGTGTNLRVLAYENFQRQILQATIRPGQFVSQRELTQLLDMPLGAVRELIPRLEAEGLLRTVPKRGLQIASVDLRLINDAFGLRRVLELHAAERFCVNASDQELKAIEDAHWSIVRRARIGGITSELLDEATAVDWGLHDRMIDSLGNALISETYRVNSLRVRLIRLDRSAQAADVLMASLREHLWFIQALRERDVPTVIVRIGLHIQSALHRVLQLPQPEIPFDLDEHTASRPPA